MPCGNQNLSDFDQFWSMFSDLKHVLCTDAIIRPLRWLPKAFAISWVLPFITATVTASVWCVHIFSVYSVLESHICQYSHRRWLYQKLKSCLASAQRRFWGRWLSPFTVRHFSDSHCPARSLPGMFVGWENVFSNMKLEWKERTVWVDANIVWGFGTGGFQMNVKGRNRRRETDEDPSRVGGF